MRLAHVIRPLTAALAALASLLVLAAPASAEVAGGFAVAPMIFDVDVQPGKTSTYQITITNADTVSQRYTFSKEDYEGNKDEPAATPVLLGGEFKSAISGYDWIALPQPVTVPAGQSRSVQVKVTPPGGSSGGHYTALVVSGASRSSAGITATSRIGVLFMMNAGGTPPPDIRITDIQEVGPTQTVTKVVYENNGQTAVTPKPTVTTVDPVDGDEIEKAVGECTTALPGGTGECTINDEDGELVGDGGGINSGATQKQVDLFGDEEGTSAKGELPTEWAGAWSSLLLPLVGIALFALYFLFLRRRRKDEEGEGELAFDTPLT